MPRPIRLTALTLVLAAAAVAGASPASAAAPAAHASRACNPPDYPGSGYFTSLNVRRVTCKFGRKLARAYYRCRTQSGPAGRCHRRRVLHFRCREVARVRISTELNGRVRCTRGGKRVVHTYQQNL
jgi:hypothetical protein